MANDNTASQWSLQAAYQGMLSYRTDTLATGDVRPEGNKGFFQLRIVAPIPIAGGAGAGGVTILPRLTVRYSQNAAGDWGLSPTDFFALVLPFEWATGRAGLGPDVVIPGKDGFGNQNVQYGGAAAVIQRAANDKVIFGILVQQVWGKGNDQDNPDCVCAANLEASRVRRC